MIKIKWKLREIRNFEKLLRWRVMKVKSILTIFIRFIYFTIDWRIRTYLKICMSQKLQYDSPVTV